MKNRVFLLFCSLFVLSISPASAMHIMEGYLPLGWCAIWYLVALPFVVLSFRYLAKLVASDPRKRITLALSGAFVFVLSAMKLPSVTGSSSHLTGTTLGTAVVGPMAMPLIGLIVLLFQALLLAHGGISTLGANVFSLAIAGPFAAYAILLIGKKIGLSTKLNIFTATFIGTMSTYICTSLQLALVYPDAQSGIWGAALKFLSIFAVTQVPLAILESIITVMVFHVLSQQGVEPLRLLISNKANTSNLKA